LHIRTLQGNTYLLLTLSSIFSDYIVLLGLCWEGWVYAAVA